MPPKAKLSKEEIIETAFEMTRENGFEHVTARELAHRLGCSRTAPSSASGDITNRIHPSAPKR